MNFHRFSFPPSSSDQGGYRKGTSSHRSVDDAEFKIGDGVTTICESRGERDRGIYDYRYRESVSFSHRIDGEQMVRMDRNRESVRIETPMDVGTEIERIVAAAERRSMENREDSLMSEVDRREGARNPVSKFSACGPRENIGRKAVSEGRARIVTTPEVRLLGEPQPKK